MCFLPRPRYSLPTARQNIAFGGLNQLPKTQIGELRASTNMDNSVLPVLKVRGGRYLVQQLERHPIDSEDTVYSWLNIFSTGGIFIKTYIKNSPGILPQITIKYTFPSDFVPTGQPLEQTETGEAANVPIWLSVQREGNSLICLPSPGRRLYVKAYSGSGESYVFTTASTSEWENAGEYYNDMCLFADRVLLAGQSEGKASIRISAKNSPLVFNDFLNEDGSLKLTGSYFETLLSEPLVACCPYSGSVILFSKTEMFILQGTNTGNYRTTKIAGIGCLFKDTAVICRDVLYWLAPDGVYAYTGGFPQRISDKLPDISNLSITENACAGTDGLRYYLAVKGRLYVYCPQNGTWIQEDEQSFNSFAFHDGKMHAVNDTQLLSFNDEQATEDVSWAFETAVYGEGEETLKKLRAVILDIEGEDKYPITVSARSQLGEALPLGSFYINNRAVYRLPVKTCACQIQSLIIEGRGKAQIYSMSREYVVGGMTNVVANPRH